MANRAIFLDRDGTLNYSYPQGSKTIPPRILSEIIILDGVIEALTKLESLEFELIVITNQPDYSRGLTSLKNLLEINFRICKEIGIKHTYICLHDTDDQCSCRKPRNGFLLQASKDFNINLTESYLIGDRLSDVQAGISSGCTSFLIGEKSNTEASSYIVVSSLLGAANLISERESQHG